MPQSLLAAFAQDQARRGLSERTIANRRRVLYSLARATPIEQATSDDIERWLDSCRLSTRSRYTYLSSVAVWFAFLKRIGARADDPTVDITRPRLPRLIPRPAVGADVEYAIAHARPRMRAWLSLCAYQGFRCVEVARLRREDVLEAHDPPLLIVSNGKGRHQSVLPLNDQVELALREYGLNRHGELFVANHGRPFKPGTVSTYIANYLHSLAIDASAHQLRHLMGSTLWKQTKDLRLTQEMLRHADPRTTAGYCAYDQEEANRVVRTLRLSTSRPQTALFALAD